MISIVLTVSAIIAGVAFVLAGAFSVAALLWGDLLESDSSPSPDDLSEAG